VGRGAYQRRTEVRGCAPCAAKRGTRVGQDMRPRAASALKVPGLLWPQYFVGDAFCGGINIEKFVSECRAPLFPEAWNHWTLLWSLKGAPSKRTLQEWTVKVMRQWFDRWHTKVGNQDFGDFDHLSVHVGDIGSVPKAPWGEYRVVATPDQTCARYRAETGIGVNVDGSAGVQAVEVRFVLRGSARDMPWPVWKPNATSIVSPLLGFNEWCPNQARVAVIQVREPDQRDVPKEERLEDLPGKPSFQIAVGGTVAALALAGGVVLVLLLKR
jgi:hypothetical protein